MRRKVIRFQDEVALQIATEFLTTDATIRELQAKYGFSGSGTIYFWIKKFGLSKPDEKTIKMNRMMKNEREKTSREEALEREVEELRKQLEMEKLKSETYQKMIEIVERNFSISIKKKAWVQTVSEMYREGNTTVKALCEILGKSKQSYYQRLSYTYQEEVKGEILYQAVMKQRKQMPRLGGRKLFSKLKEELPEVLQMGRDKFFAWLRANNLLVRKRKVKIYTTHSHHWLHKYPYLLDGYNPKGANQLWVSDITYINTDEGVMYLFLLSDAWSKKILGWELSDNMRAENAIKALKMALRQWKDRSHKLIHHSDRGVQYCSEKYVQLLEKNGINISMTQSSNPLDNSIAERINGILKDEWLYDKKLETRQGAVNYVKKIISIYNNDRPHMSLGMRTPNYFHCEAPEGEQPKKLWRSSYGKRVKRGRECEVRTP